MRAEPLCPTARAATPVAAADVWKRWNLSCSAGLWSWFLPLSFLLGSWTLPSYGHHSQGCFWLSCPQPVFCKYQVQQRTASCWLFSHLCQKVVIRGLKKSPRMFCPGIALPADTRVAEVPHEGQGVYTQGFLHLFGKGLICFLFLIRKSFADVHYNSTHVGLPANLHLQALDWLLTHS